MTRVVQDFRFAFRALSREPGFALAAVLTLALGIAVTNTVFSIINTAILRDVPFDEPDRLVLLTTRDGRGRSSAGSYLDFRDWRDSTKTLSGVAASSGTSMSISDEGRLPERIRGGYVSANAFALLRQAPIIGRDFFPADDRPGSPLVVLLNHALWQNRYGGDRNVIGRSVRVNDVTATIIGVMPQGFRFPFSEDVWLPLSGSPAVSAARSARSLMVFGRMSPSATRQQTQAELDAIAARLSRTYPETNRDIRVRVAAMKGEFIESARPILAVFMAAVGLVLLIACANVANLLLSRSANRTREFAIRTALGATRWHIVRQVLTESMILAAVAGVVGLVLSVYGVAFLGTVFDGREPGASLAEARRPYWVDLSMNATVYVFMAAMCFFVGCVAGLAPALQSSKANTIDALKSGGRGVAGLSGTRRWASSFMVVQISLTLMLLTAAGLLVRSFLELYLADRVIDTSQVVTARLTLPTQKYSNAAEQRRFIEDLDDRLTRVSFFQSVTMSSDLPFTFANSMRSVSVEPQRDPAHQRPPVPTVLVGRRYFETLGLRIVRGRSLRNLDESSGEAGVVVNQRFAAVFFPDVDPIGQRIVLSGLDSPRTIVGVSQTLPFSSPPPRQSEDAAVYVPLLGSEPPRTIGIIVRSSATVPSVATRLRQEIQGLDSGLPLYSVQTLDQVFANNRFALRILGGWFGFLALIGVTLASVGLYALTAQAVARRTQEIGVRMALGAEPSQVVRLFLGRAVVQVSIGLLLGVAGALGAGQLMHSMLVRTEPRDPLTLAAVSALLIVVAGVATILPARRAARVDPLVALRYE